MDRIAIFHAIEDYARAHWPDCGEFPVIIPLRRAHLAAMVPWSVLHPDEPAPEGIAFAQEIITPEPVDGLPGVLAIGYGPVSKMIAVKLEDTTGEMGIATSAWYTALRVDETKGAEP